jgi:hypothetical protein
VHFKAKFVLEQKIKNSCRQIETVTEEVFVKRNQRKAAAGPHKNFEDRQRL